MHIYDNYVRWLYKANRPNWFARLQNQASAAVYAAGIWPRRVAAIDVRGRKSGRVISFPWSLPSTAASVTSSRCSART
jgi:hypothetical protein